MFREVDGQVEVLLLFRKAGDFPHFIDGDIDSYHLPKGHLEMGETLEQAALRETAEEAGCEVKLKTYLGSRLNQYTDVGIERDKAIHYFAGDWVKDLDGMDHEHSDRVWMSVDEAIKKIGGTNPKREDEVIRRFKKYLELTSGESA
ncbi:NUDIX domain-containing protein [Candidatus Saccharibacteria bacterium]|nr:NUDIX domain-containing protein [Candidatus Saccharibacteria bacterium]